MADVLAVTPLYPPESRVGAWLATHEFLAALAARGHQVTVHTTLAKNPVSPVDGVRVCGSRSDLADLAANADVVVTHVRQGADAAVAARKPCVQMGHGGNAQVFPGVALVVANSETFAGTFTAGRVVVCHPYTDPTRYRCTRGDSVTLINLSEAKGGALFWRIARAMPDVQFLGVRGGYGPQTSGRGPNIAMQANTADMRSVYTRTRILLMPSRLETWGMTAVEAMCSGIPVIANPTPGLCESLGDAGIFVDRRDAAGWIAAIRRLDDPDVYAEASARSVRRFAEIPDHRGRFCDAVESLP